MVVERSLPSVLMICELPQLRESVASAVQIYLTIWTMDLGPFVLLDTVALASNGLGPDTNF